MVAANSQVVVGADFGFAICVGGAVLLGLELAVAVGLDGVVAFVADADLPVLLVQRGKEWKTLDVIPVAVREENVDGAVVFLDELAQVADPGTGMEAYASSRDVNLAILKRRAGSACHASNGGKLMR